MSTDNAGDIHLTRLPVEAAPRPRDPADHYARPYRASQHAEEGTEQAGGKRALPSPEGEVRQAALPQPHTGRERREEEEDQWLSRGWFDENMPDSNHDMLLERQEPKSHPRSRTFSGGEDKRIWFHSGYLCSVRCSKYDTVSPH